MPLIDKSDVLQDIESVELDSITSQDDDIITTAIDDAETMAKNFLRHKFDIVALFSKVGAARDRDLVETLRGMALFRLSTRLSPNTIPENRMINDEKAEKFLERVRSGELTTDWDEIVPDQGDNTSFGFTPKTKNTY